MRDCLHAERPIQFPSVKSNFQLLSNDTTADEIDYNTGCASKNRMKEFETAYMPKTNPTSTCQVDCARPA